MSTPTTEFRLSRKEYKTIFLSILGGALEIYDFIIYVFLAAILADVFFPTDIPQWLGMVQSMMIFSVGYIARPFGGILMAHYADRLGRKVMFNFTLVFMALPCLLTGLMPTYAQIGYMAPLLLVLLRLIQGAALGGEVPNAWVFVAEHVVAQRRGLALGLLQAGLTFGYLLGAFTVMLLTTIFDKPTLVEWAWRIPFVIGGVFGVIAVWLRRWLQETPIFLALKQQRALAVKLPLTDVIRQHKRAVIPSVVLTALLATVMIINVVVTPMLLQKVHLLSPQTTFRISCVAILLLNIGCIAGGWLADKLGAWRTFTLYSVLMGLGIIMLALSMQHSVNMTMISYLLICLFSGIVGVVPAIMVQLFPPEVKVTGISLTYNATYSLCSATLPILFIGLFTTQPLMIVGLGGGAALIGLLTARIYRHSLLPH